MKNCVRKLRIYKGIKQEEIAKELKLNHFTFRKIERNERKIKDSEEEKLALIFNVSKNQLYEDY